MSKKTWVHHSPSNRNTTCLAENPELNLCHWNWVWGLLKLYLFSLTHLKPISFKTCLCLCTGLASHNWWISTLNMGKTWGIFEELGELCFFKLNSFLEHLCLLFLQQSLSSEWTWMSWRQTKKLFLTLVCCSKSWRKLFLWGQGSSSHWNALEIEDGRLPLLSCFIHHWCWHVTSYAIFVWRSLDIEYY